MSSGARIVMPGGPQIPFGILKPKKLRKVRMHGGPMHGVEVEVGETERTYRVGGFWTYEDTRLNAKDGVRLFAKRPRGRRVRQMLLYVKVTTGRDQRLYEPNVPTRGTTSSLHRGRNRRAALRAIA